MRTIKTTLLLIILQAYFYPASLYSQKVDGWGLEGGVLYTDLEDPFNFYFSMMYNYYPTPHTGLILGTRFNYSKIDLRFRPSTNSQFVYDLEDNILNLNGLVGATLLSPSYKGIGIMGDLLFLFSPIPYNIASINKINYNTPNNYPEEKSRNKIVYTHFNPAFEIKVNLFYEVSRQNKKARLVIGSGITNYNPYNTYYHTKIEKIALNEYLKLRPDKIGILAFIRLEIIK